MMLEKARYEDLQGVLDMLDHCNRVLSEKGLYQWDEKYPNRNFYEACIEDGELFLLKEEEHMVGTVVLNEDQDSGWSDINWQYTQGAQLIIHALLIDPDCQGKGYGQQALELCETYARKSNYSGIRLDAFSENPVALALYVKNGYQKVGEVYFESKPVNHQCYYCYEKEFRERRPVEAFIFDMDGVLIDSEPLHVAMEIKMLAELGIDITEDEMSQFIGTTNEHMWNTLIDRYNIKKTYQELVDHSEHVKKTYFETEDLHPIEGIPDLLIELKKRNIKLAVASSSPEEHINIITKKLGIDGYFQIMVSGEHVAHSKPAPDIFLRASELLGVGVEGCVVVEDSTHGIAAAKAAGMYCIGYEGPSSVNQSYDKADKVVGEFSNKLLINFSPKSIN